MFHLIHSLFRVHGRLLFKPTMRGSGPAGTPFLIRVVLNGALGKKIEGRECASRQPGSSDAGGWLALVREHYLVVLPGSSNM